MKNIIIDKLAIDGGTPVRTKGPITEQDVIGEEEVQALLDVVKQKKLRRADTTDEYEKKLADWFGAKYAIAVSSGTTSLHIALAAFGIGPGDEVIVAPYTFIASDTAVLEQNAIPVFADIDPVHLGLDPEDVERKITPRTKAIIPVNVAGNLVDMDAIMDLAHKHNLWVLEDAAQAFGATYKGKKVGTIGHVGSFSTITGKLTSTGEGGFVITDDETLYEKMWGYMDFARRRSMGKASKYRGATLYNYRITNMAAVGINRWKRADSLVRRRTENALFVPASHPAIPFIKIRLSGSRTDMLNFAVALAEGVYDLNTSAQPVGSCNIWNPCF
jgi:dTDP-4-amino-4,6-dideoxygalactose transaminase